MDEIKKAIQERKLQIEDRLDNFSKGQTLPIGTIRKRPNGNFIKTPGGWKYHSKNTKSVAVGTEAKAASNGDDSFKVGSMVSIKKDLPFLASIENLRGERMKITGSKQVEFASGPEIQYYVEINGKSAIVPERFVEQFKEPTIRDVLADTEGKKIIESVEEYIGDLRDQPGRTEHIQGLRYDVDALKDKFGYHYDIKEQETNYKSALKSSYEKAKAGAMKDNPTQDELDQFDSESKKYGDLLRSEKKIAPKHIGDMTRTEADKWASKLGIKDPHQYSTAVLHNKIIEANVDKKVTEFKEKKKEKV